MAVDVSLRSKKRITVQCMYSYLFQGKTQNGYMSMCAAINRTLEEGIPLTDPEFYGKITETDLDKYFIGDDNVSCPMIKQRVDCLHEIAKVMLF